MADSKDQSEGKFASSGIERRLKTQNRSILNEVRDKKIQSAGEFIRKLRIEQALSQEEVAKILQVSQSYWSKIENDRLEIRIAEWFRFCDLMRIPVTSYRFFID